MDPVYLGIIIPILVGPILLIGMKMLFSHLEDKRLGGGAQQEVQHLADTVENLRAEVEQLNERMEFTERLLQRPKTEE